MNPSSFSLTASEASGACVLHLGGWVDYLLAKEFETRLFLALDPPWAKGQAVVLDLTKLEYISSAGLRGLMLAARRARSIDRLIVLACPQTVVNDVLETCRFGLVMPIYATLAGALRGLRGEPV